MNIRSILVISGNYDIYQQAKRAIADKRVTVQAAYSHIDAIYSATHQPFDALLVDAAMFDRHSGEATIITMKSLHECPPIIAYVSDALSDINARRAAEYVLTTLNPREIREMLARVLFGEVGTGALPQVIVQEKPKRDGRSDEEIQTLLALSRSLTEVLDLSEVLNRVVDAARRLTDADEGMILMPDGESGQLYLRARVGIDLETARNFRVRTSNTLAGEVLANGKPTLIGASGPLKVKTEYFVNSLLYVPIISKGQAIGVLGVNNKTKDDMFDLRHQELLLNLASYAAIAIENARIHEQSVRRARELKALVDASRVINASLSLEIVLPNMCAQFVRVVNVNHAEIFEWLPERRELRTLARYFETIWSPGHEPVIQLSDSEAMRRAVEKRRLVSVGSNDGMAALMEPYGVGSILLVPIAGGEQIYGVIRAFFIQPNQPAPSTDAVQRTQRSAMELLMNLTDGQPSRIIKIAREIVQALNADGCDFALISSDGKTLKVHVSIGYGVWMQPPSTTIQIDDYPDLQEVIQNGTPLNQHHESPPTPGAAALMQISFSRSVLALPLVHRGKQQGVVLFGDALHAHCFNQREIDLATAIVGQAATALENGRLLHDLEKSLRELKDTQDRLIQTERLSAMGELAAAVAHQVNNPLATIVMDSELLLSKAHPGTPDHESLSAIFRAGKRAAGVVRRLLASVRMDSTTAPPEPVDVVRTIDETVALVRSHVNREQIRLHWKPPQYDLPPVLMRPGELDDVWLNLLLNAHDALSGRPGAEMGIEVRYLPQQEIVQVDVWDNGPGIPDTIVKEIFKPFFTTKPVGEGTGLGLHICRQIVETAGGTIDVVTRLNEGTQFTVQLAAMRSR